MRISGTQSSKSRSQGDGPFQRKPNGSGRITFAVPLGRTPSTTAMRQAIRTVRDETGFVVDIDGQNGAAFVDTNSQNAPHVVLDVAESALQNSAGDGAGQLRASRKSLIHASGETNREAQPCFVLSRRFTDQQVAEIERLLNFVAGVSAVGYHNQTRFYLSPGSQSLGHATLDVAEILVRRVADKAGIGVSDHSIKLLPQR
jgi:hypothetical protein